MRFTTFRRIAIGVGGVAVAVLVLLMESAGTGALGSAAIGGVAPGSTNKPSVDNLDLNSLIPSHVDEAQWLPAGSTLTRYPGVRNDDENYHRMVYIDPERSVSTQEVRYPYLVPTGCTAVTLTVPGQRPSFAGYATTLANAHIANSSDVAQASVALDFTSTGSGVTLFTATHTEAAGTQGFANVITAQNDFPVKVGRTRLVPTCASGFFSVPFARYDITPGVLWDNARLDSVNGFNEPSSFARFIFDTTADSFVAETIETINFGASPHLGDALVLVNGEVLDTTINITQQAASTLAQTTYTLPSALSGQLKRVEIYQGIRQQSAPNAGNVNSAVVRAIYVPQSATTRVVRPVTDKALRVYVLGDSILTATGTIAANNTESIALLLRRMAPATSWIFDGDWSGNSIEQVAGSSGKRAATMTNILSGGCPQVVFSQLGTNDYGGNTASAATVQADLGLLVDQILKSCPATVIQFMTPTLRTTETANGSGNTTDDYRTAITNVVAQRGLPTALNGKTMIASTDLFDGTHLSNSDAAGTIAAGQEKVASAIINAIAAPVAAVQNTLVGDLKSIGAGPPTVTSGSCTAETIRAGGDDNHGEVTATCTAQTWIVTWSVTKTAAPVCTVVPMNAAAAADVGTVYTTSSTALTVTVTTATTSGVWAYHCIE